MEILLVVAIIAMVVLTAGAYVVGRRSAPKSDAKELEFERQRGEELGKRLAEREKEVEEQRGELVRLTSERDVQRATAEALLRQLAERTEEFREQVQRQKEELEAAHARAVDEMRQSHAKLLAEAKDGYEQQLKQLREMNREQVESQLKLIQEQMQTTSEKVLRARQEELDKRNIEQVSQIVDPLNQSLKMMKEALSNNSKEHNESITRLDATIKANMERSRELGERAERLANALTGEVKVQGNFGELKLKQLFEDLGLSEGEQYSTQQALVDRLGNKIKSEEEKLLIPDFILHFPNNRDVIVDSKVNITAFERYMSCEDADEKSRYLAEHIRNVRTQVDNLAKKDYSKYLDTSYTKLNFVIMYMFHEGALNLALLNDNSLWRYAYDKGVLILGPQTMYMNLRILELMWVQSRQLSNQKDMIRYAEMVVERTQDFVERFRAVRESVDTTVKKIKELDITTSTSGQSVIVAAKNLIKCGVRENKKKKVALSSLFIENDDMAMLTDTSTLDPQPDDDTTEVA